MCGRYSLVINPDQLVNQFGVSIELPPEGIPENYNVAPTQSGLVLTDRQPDRFSLLRWGLIPFWAKDKKIGYKMINARSETIQEKPSFRDPVRKRRCLVIADSFYEWKREGKQKQPLRILRTDDSYLVMAGIWSNWRDPATDENLSTFSVITTTPNADMQGIHDRMPVVFPTSEGWEEWLDPQLTPARITALLSPPAPDTLKSYPVATAVGNVRNNGPELHAPLS